MPEILGTLKPPRLASAPGSPALGQLYYDTGTNILMWWNGTAWVAAQASAPAPATTLPGSPTNNQPAVLVDNTTTPTYAWQLQWSSTASKWVFTGGSAFTATAATGGTLTNSGSTWTDLPTPFSMTVPRAGVYECEFGLRLGGGQAIQIAPKFGANATNANDAVYLDQATGVTVSLMRRSVSPALSASDVIKLQFNSASGGNPAGWTPVNIWMKLTPVYVT